MTFVVNIPKIFYETDTTAIAVFDSRENLFAWWKENRAKPLFEMVVADRMAMPESMRLRVDLGYINEGMKIQTVLEKAGLKCQGVPLKKEEQKADGKVGGRCMQVESGKSYQIGDHNYKVDKLIGKGCYGQVFLAYDVESGKKVAIKVLSVQGDKEDQQLKKIHKAGSHPHIVRYIGSGTIFNKTCIVMEYIEGVTYAEYTKTAPFGPELQKQYDSAEEFWIKAGVDRENENERENIMITMKDGKPFVKVIDFGTLSRR